MFFAIMPYSYDISARKLKGSSIHHHFFGFVRVSFNSVLTILRKIDTLHAYINVLIPLMKVSVLGV